MNLCQHLGLNISLSFLIFGMAACGPSSNSQLRIVGGESFPASDKLQSYLANVKSGENLSCTGVLASPMLILTAAHCLPADPSEPLSIELPYFPDAAPKVKKSLKFWDEAGAFFPNFDLAWIRLEEPAAAGLEPLPILRDPNLLVPGSTLALAGFGPDSRPTLAVSEFERYADSPHLMSVLTLRGQGKTVTSRGDSGSPSFLWRDGEWLLVGTTSGKHPILTPEAYENGALKASSPATLQSFIGDYASWIESTSGVQIAQRFERSEPSHIEMQKDVSELSPPASWSQWMNQANFRAASWATVHKLLEQMFIVGSQKGIKASWPDLFTDTDVSTELLPLLENLPGTTIGLGSQRIAIVDLSPLASLPTLKNLSLDDRPYRGLEFLSQIPSLEKLEVKARFSGRPAASGLGLERIAGAKLQELNLQGLALSDLQSVRWDKLQALRKLGLKGQKGEGLPSSALGFLPALSSQLESLRLENWYCDGRTLTIDARSFLDLGQERSKVANDCVLLSGTP